MCANLPQDNGKVARREVAPNAISVKQDICITEIFVLSMISAHPVPHARQKTTLFAQTVFTVPKMILFALFVPEDAINVSIA